MRKHERCRASAALRRRPAEPRRAQPSPSRPASGAPRARTCPGPAPGGRSAAAPPPLPPAAARAAARTSGTAPPAAPGPGPAPPRPRRSWCRGAEAGARSSSARGEHAAFAPGEPAAAARSSGRGEEKAPLARRQQRPRAGSTPPASAGQAPRIAPARPCHPHPCPQVGCGAGGAALEPRAHFFLPEN